MGEPVLVTGLGVVTPFNPDGERERFWASLCAGETAMVMGVCSEQARGFCISAKTQPSVVWLLANGVTRPVLALTKVADRIGVGDYDQDFTNLHKERFHDEVDKLASVFELMVSKVYTREKDLRARVQQLEIMIDQGKREREVQQIVESDFFQDLRGKVKDMRERFQKEE